MTILTATKIGICLVLDYAWFSTLVYPELVEGLELTKI